jgi:hypothetical protein
MICLTNQGKTNKTGRLDEHGIFRHRHVELCAVGAVGFYFFSHFHILQTAIPDFTPDFDNPKYGEFGHRPWYDRLLFPGKSNTEEMSYLSKCSLNSVRFLSLTLEPIKITMLVLWICIQRIASTSQKLLMLDVVIRQLLHDTMEPQLKKQSNLAIGVTVQMLIDRHTTALCWWVRS